MNKGVRKGKEGSDGWEIVSADVAYSLRQMDQYRAAASGEPTRGRQAGTGSAKDGAKGKGQGKGGKAQPSPHQTREHWRGGWSQREWDEWDGWGNDNLRGL